LGISLYFHVIEGARIAGTSTESPIILWFAVIRECETFSDHDKVDVMAFAENFTYKPAFHVERHISKVHRRTDWDEGLQPLLGNCAKGALGQFWSVYAVQIDCE
jgi:hypothetical protein